MPIGNGRIYRYYLSKTQLILYRFPIDDKKHLYNTIYHFNTFTFGANVPKTMFGYKEIKKCMFFLFIIIYSITQYTYIHTRTTRYHITTNYLANKQKSAATDEIEYTFKETHVTAEQFNKRRVINRQMWQTHFVAISTRSIFDTISLRSGVYNLFYIYYTYNDGVY